MTSLLVQSRSCFCHWIASAMYHPVAKELNSRGIQNMATCLEQTEEQLVDNPADTMVKANIRS